MHRVWMEGASQGEVFILVFTFWAMGMIAGRITSMSSVAGAVISPAALERRGHVHSMLMAVIWAGTLLIFDSAVQALIVSLFFSLLWHMTAVDVERCEISEVNIFVLGIAMAWVTLVGVGVQWTNPVSVLFGMACTASLVTFCAFSMKSVNKALKRETQDVLFGDGDLLVLMALAMFFGMDTLQILFFACMVTIPAHIWNNYSDRLWVGLGHVPGRLGQGMPFMPGIFFGTCVTVFLSHPMGWSFNPMTVFLYGSLHF